jgi:PIN domain nuclease of toxin-antitoxin system
VILLDTHVVLWLTTDPTKLSSKGKSAIEDARKNGDGLAISDITLLELATLASKGRIHLGISLESFLQEVEARFVVLPISGRACARAIGLPTAYPKDPADRVVSMGRRNTRPKSTYKASMAKSRSPSVDSSGTPSWPGSDRLQPDKAILHAEVLSDQLTRWCCIDRLSWQR